MKKTLANVLNQHLADSNWSFEKLAEASGLPRNTVYRWTKGEVRRVRHWQDVAKVARALMLNRSQTNVLLQIAGHPSIDILLERARDDADRALLSRWTLVTHNNLPAQLTSFIGREDAVDAIARLLATSRLVTLTGTGGSGKTRLALEVAHTVMDDFEAVYLIELASVHDPDLVLSTISQTLGLTESLDEPPLNSLEANLRNRKVLLVLDNLEQVIEAAPLVVELLAATQLVNALVTSRTRLNVRGEHEFQVPPLSLPDPASSFEEIAINPSVALFVDRAQTANLSFTLTPANAPLVAEVCLRLEGLPLSIELAAARTRQVPLGSMLERFPGRLALASEGPRDVPNRQRALRATIAWSYDLLGRNEQRLFNSIGVFVGGFTEDAARSVCNATRPLGIEVSEGLESLVEQNLLRQVWGPDDESRYEMLETIREYARENLKARGEMEATVRAACQYYVELVERADLRGGGQMQWLHRLAADHDNFRAALDWCWERGQHETGLRLSIALMPLWQLRDQQLEAHAWLETFMATGTRMPSHLQAKELLWQGVLQLRVTGNDGPASPLLAEALTLFRDAGDLDGTSETLQAEGEIFRNRGDLEIAKQRYAESLESARQTGNAYLMARAHLGLALCVYRTEGFANARQHWALTLEWAEKAGDKANMALALNGLGEAARNRGDWREAEGYYEETLRLGRALGSEFRIALALHNLGYMALAKGEVASAEMRFKDSLSRYKTCLNHQGEAECLAGLARVAALEGRLERAARLCGSTEALLERLGTRLDTLDRADYERTLGILGNQLDNRLELILNEGRSMSRERAVEYALADRFTES
jgi:predicted ATPase/transcriptional regulator with XRE-family HTH domain